MTNQRLEEANEYLEYVIGVIDSLPGYTACKWGDALNDDNIRPILQKDGFGYNYARNFPDIIMTKDTYVFYGDAKHSHNPRTNNHLIDVVALEGYLRFTRLYERPFIIAYWHTDGHTGYGTIDDYNRLKHVKKETGRGSHAKYFWLAKCHCRPLDDVIDELLEFWKDAA
jgi:hypothetical protein